MSRLFSESGSGGKRGIRLEAVGCRGGNFLVLSFRFEVGGYEITGSGIPKTKNTIAAIEKFVALQLIALGILQLLAAHFELEIKSKARCFLRTPCTDVPSIFITKIALANIIRANLANFAKDLITKIIIDKQRRPEYNEGYRNAA